MSLLVWASTATCAQTIAKAPQSASPADDGQWTMPGKDYASTRFSELTEINAANVRGLKVAFTVDTGTKLGEESAPIVANGTLYFVTPYPNKLFAIDLLTGQVKWTYDPQANSSAQGAACCEGVNRGPVYSEGTVFYNTIDDQTVAVDAATGKRKWQVKLDDFNKGSTMTGAPFVVRDKVFVGNSGAEFGARGWLTALNLRDGSIAWRAYATGPDKDVLIDPAVFKPFYPQYKGTDLGVKQWPADAWKIGGGTSWGWMSYDPDQDLIFYGTSNPSPWNDRVRPGDNLWTDGVFARNPDTGKARWYYQFSPHDLWDHSSINENLILDMPWQGQIRKVIVRPERNGFIYVIDRISGQVLAADPFVFINDALGVNMKSGRLIDNPAKVPQPGEVMRNVCPDAPGAKDWNPSAFGKDTGLIYVPHNNLCMDWQLGDVGYISGTPYIGVNVRFFPGPGGNAGEFMAWDPVRRPGSSWDPGGCPPARSAPWSRPPRSRNGPAAAGAVRAGPPAAVPECSGAPRAVPRPRSRWSARSPRPNRRAAAPRTRPRARRRSRSTGPARARAGRSGRPGWAR